MINILLISKGWYQNMINEANRINYEDNTIGILWKKKPFFKNLSIIGDLYIRKTLFEFDKMPILFVCVDRYLDYYLCLCVDSIIENKWLITKTKPSLLIKLIENKISIYDTFQRSNNEIIIAKQTKNGFTYQAFVFNDIPEDELPEKTEKLDNNCLNDFLKELKNKECL